MKPAVLRPIVVLAVVAAVWGQAPAAHAVRGGGNGQQAGRSGIKTDGGGRITVFHDVETDLNPGQVSVREIVREYGLITESVGTFTDASSTFVTSQVYTRDRSGNAVKVVTEDSIDDVLLDRIVELATFDKFGREISTRAERDLDGDGDLDASDAIETFTWPTTTRTGSSPRPTGSPTAPACCCTSRRPPSRTA